jgi:hypothetical protein
VPKRTSQVIVSEAKPGQIDTLAQLAGDFACQRKWKVFFSKWKTRVPSLKTIYIAQHTSQLIV